MVNDMATKQVTITVDTALMTFLEERAAAAGSKLSPFIARAARNWVLWEDAARLAQADRKRGRDAEAEAEAELALRYAAEDEAKRGGHAA